MSHNRLVVIRSTMVEPLSTGVLTNERNVGSFPAVTKRVRTSGVIGGLFNNLFSSDNDAFWACDGSSVNGANRSKSGTSPPLQPDATRNEGSHGTRDVHQSPRKFVINGSVLKLSLISHFSTSLLWPNGWDGRLNHPKSISRTCASIRIRTRIPDWR
jgi:hypothetical protein